MTVIATSPVATPAASTSAASSAAAPATTQSLNYNDFLSLLMAEMKNQDPTQPMDPSQMVSQLATVSEVGQAVQTNTSLASLLDGDLAHSGRTARRPDHRLFGRFDVRPGRLGQRDERRRGRHPHQWLDRLARQRRDSPVNEGDAIDLAILGRPNEVDLQHRLVLAARTSGDEGGASSDRRSDCRALLGLSPVLLSHAALRHTPSAFLDRVHRFNSCRGHQAADGARARVRACHPTGRLHRLRTVAR